MNPDERITSGSKIRRSCHSQRWTSQTPKSLLLVVCEKHGDYEQRQRSIAGLVRLPGRRQAAGCLKDELVFLRSRRQKRMTELALRMLNA